MNPVGPITSVGRPWFGPTKGFPPWYEPWHTSRSQFQPSDPSVLAQWFKHLAHGSLGPYGSKQVCNQTQLWTTLHMTSGDITKRLVVGQGPQRLVGRPTNWVMPPSPASHRPMDLLEGQWHPLSSRWQVGRPTCGPHLESVHSHRRPPDEHVMKIPNC